MNVRKGKLGTPASPPTPAQHGETEHFILWPRDGGRIAEIEVPSFRPRAEVLSWEGRSFLWHEKTRRYVEAVSFVVTKKPTKRQSQGVESSFQFDSGEPDDPLASPGPVTALFPMAAYTLIPSKGSG